MAEEGGRWLKIPQIGRVVIGADCRDRRQHDDRSRRDRRHGDRGRRQARQPDPDRAQLPRSARTRRSPAASASPGARRIGRNCKIGGAAMIVGHLHDSRRHDRSPAATPVIRIRSASTACIPASFPALPHREWQHVASGIAPVARRSLARVRRARAALAPSNRRAKGSAMTLDSSIGMTLAAQLPRRYPALLIDRVLECVPGKSARAHEERHRQRAVLPGPLSRLSGDARRARASRRWSQLSTLLCRRRPALTAAARARSPASTSARFKRQVIPGDHADAGNADERIVRGIGKFTGRARLSSDETGQREASRARRRSRRAAGARAASRRTSRPWRRFIPRRWSTPARSSRDDVDDRAVFDRRRRRGHRRGHA